MASNAKGQRRCISNLGGWKPSYTWYSLTTHRSRCLDTYWFSTPPEPLLKKDFFRPFCLARAIFSGILLPCHSTLHTHVCIVKWPLFGDPQDLRKKWCIYMHHGFTTHNLQNGKTNLFFYLSMYLCIHSPPPKKQHVQTPFEHPQACYPQVI